MYLLLNKRGGVEGRTGVGETRRRIWRGKKTKQGICLRVDQHGLTTTTWELLN